MEERERFVVDWARGGRTMRELCAQYGVTRQTGQKWVKRLLDDGPSGFREHSRRPREFANASDPRAIAALVDLKRSHPQYGPKKLVALLRDASPTYRIPAPSTAGEALKKHGLVKARRQRRSTRAPVTSALSEPKAPNDLWCADFKGEFRLGDGRWCWPLTITDAVSRYLIRCVALEGPLLFESQLVFLSAFREFGKPRAIRTDNGTPFVSASSATGLTRLSAMWVSHGIALERTRPAHPQDNGQHERFHRTLKEATTIPPGPTLGDQQQRFDAFRDEYNEHRPHEALGQSPPAKHYTPSPNRFTDEPPTPSYPDHWLTKRVACNGALYLSHREISIGQGLARQLLGLEPIAVARWRVHFAWYALGELDERSELFEAYGPQSPASDLWHQEEHQDASALSALAADGEYRAERPTSDETLVQV